MAAFIGQDLREGEAGVVVNSDMHELPASAATGPRAISGNAMTGAEEAAELLDVEMQQIAGGGMFVAAQGPSRFEIADTVQAGAAQDAGWYATLPESSDSRVAGCGAVATRDTRIV